jgi:hypothetical protein
MTNSNHGGLDPVDPKQQQIRDHEQFVELCALATAGPLPEDQASQLQAHLEDCSECREAMAEFRFVAVEGASLIAPVEARTEDRQFRLAASQMTGDYWSPEAAKQNLLARIAAEEEAGRRRMSLPTVPKRVMPRLLARLSWQQRLQYSVAVLIFFGIVAVSGYRLRTMHGERRGTDGYQGEMQAQLLFERSELEKQLKSHAASIEDLSHKLEEREMTIQGLKKALVSAELQEKNHVGELSTALTLNTSLATERDSLLHKLQDAETSTVSLQGQLDSLRTERRNDLVRVSDLEMRIEQLNGRLRESQVAVSQQQDLLVSDRDIRDLMGARNLYITDVVDVDKNGHTQKPFGRIFYTKGKSLIFYAFDLDEQRGFRNAAFQLWGQQGSDRSNSVNMGIFYMDNEANRRWVLKFGDPEKLARINSVFVTVEPNGGSQKPGGKQLLYASLRTLPNHP